MAVVQYKTPGVYVEEIDAFPPSIVGVETAVPVFIGYTEKAEQNGRDVKGHPVRIGSMVEYSRIFGGAYEPHFTLDAAKLKAAMDEAATKEAAASKAETDNATDAATKRAEATTARAKANALNVNTVTIGGKTYSLTNAAPRYLYNSLRLFYANGGGSCYIVSVAGYTNADGTPADVTQPILESGLTAVEDLVGPTMLVIPEAVLLAQDKFNSLCTKMLLQCEKRQDRVAILDIWGVDQLTPETASSDFVTRVNDFREGIGGSSSALKYGMAYTPFLKTSIVDPSELDFTNIASRDVLITALGDEMTQLGLDDAKKTKIHSDYLDKSKMDAVAAKPISDLGRIADALKIDQGLTAQLPVLKDVYAAMAARLGTLPPSGAMAGVYTRNDALRGVWNAPANVGLVSVIGPTVQISNKMQDDLNMPIGGLAVNAIRDFVGRGTLVWGARTLDGNSNDWRYIQVRRALIYIEQSIELALNKFVFEPNVAQTWVNVASMVGSFLRGVWQAGGLMGAAPQEAYSVQCGLGSTMTAQDVLEGRMIVKVKLTMVHPAEFIILTFQQQMQGGA